MSLPLDAGDWPILPETGRPALVRSLEAPRESFAETWKRLKPAWMVSGGLHLVMLLLGLVFYWVYSSRAATPPPLNLRTLVQDTAPTDYDLLDPRIGLDPKVLDLAPPTEIPPASGPEPAPTDPFGVAGNDGPPVQAIPEAPGMGPRPGTAGTGTSGLAQRGNRDARAALVRTHGGNDASEAAVARSLAWLARQQRTDGRWVVSDGSYKDDVAATAVALLPFLAAGETHKTGRRYRQQVLAGLTWLVAQQKSNGEFPGTTLYTHALATIAVCEAFGMSQDGKLANKAQGAVNFIANAQGPDGGWRYSIGQPGDTSVTGWMVQALKSGELADLSVPRSALEKASKFLDRLAVEGGAKYGYLDKGSTRTPITAVGLLTRQYLGWTPKNKELQAGVEELRKHLPQAKGFDVYYAYYATQVVHFYGGEVWSETWNPRVRDLLVKRQEQGEGSQLGSWPADDTETGRAGGRLVATALSTLTLEVYYRHLPLYRSPGEGLDDPE